MTHRADHDVAGPDDHAPPASARGGAPGKSTLTSRLWRSARRDDRGVAPGAEEAVAGLGGGGAPLPGGVRDRFEASLGADLGAVRVHTDDASATAADAVGARAFARGNDIHFAAGQYQPDDPFGMHLLAHEVAHTVQQSGGAATTQFKLAVSSPGDAAEVEADRAADAMVAGAPAVVGASGVTSVMKKSVDNPPGTGSKTSSPSIKVNGEDEVAPVGAADWAAYGGDKLIAAVRPVLVRWKAYRDQPKDNKFKGRDEVAKATAKFEGDVPEPKWAAMRAQANRELGAADLAALEELVAMEKWGAAAITAVFNVKARDVRHTYRLTLTESSVLSQGVLSYENDLPTKWSWRHPITLALGGLKASLYPPGLKPAVVTLSGSFDKVTTQGYFGWADFAGVVMAMKGSGAKGQVAGVGAEIKTGTALTFPALDVTFDNLKLKSSVEGAGSGGKIEVSGGELGGGGAKVGAEAADVDTGDLSTLPGLVDVTFEQKAVLNMFETGSADLTPPMLTAVEELRRSIDTFRHDRIDPHVGTLKKLGRDVESLMHLDVELTGWASRRWEGAVDDTERRARNEKLSLARATRASQACNDALSGWHLAVTTHGRGARMYSAALGGTVGEGELVGRIHDLEQRTTAIKMQLAQPGSPSQKSALIDEQTKLSEQKAGLEADLDKKKNAMDSPQDQCVNIVVRWKGQLPDQGTPALPKKGKPKP